MDYIKLGYAPTRRSIFSAPDAIKYRGLTAQRLTELGVDFVDITDINEEGLLYNDADMLKIAEKFKAEKIDGLFYHTAILGRNTNVQGWQRNWGCRFFYGDHWMSARSRMVHDFGIPSAGYLQPERY